MRRCIWKYKTPKGFDDLVTGYIIPKPFDRRLRDIVPAAVAEAARRTGVARL